LNEIRYIYHNLEMVENKIKSLIDQEIKAIQNIPVDGIIEKAVDLIHSQVHIHKGKVVVSGMGKAGQIGHNIATTLSSTGTPSAFIHPSEAQHGDMGLVQENDILILISNSGKTREIVEFDTLVKRVYPDIKVILITGNKECDLAKSAEVCIHTGDPKEICPLGLTPTTSTTVMTVVGDVLVVLLMDKIGYTKEQYALRHHSGYLGQKARGDG
jgi:arabinose-5-phosphate isomerase